MFFFSQETLSYLAQVAMQGITEDLKKNVRSVLISNPKGVKIDQLHRDYRSLLGHPVDFRRCGFRNMVEFLEAMPDVAQ